MQEIIDYYNRYDEENRLCKDNYHRTEFLVTLKLLAPYLEPGSRILDVGAGTGRYSVYYAERGFTVDALDLTPKHVDAIQDKIVRSGLGQRLTAKVGDARDLSACQDEAYDAVLCMGPLYHLSGTDERLQCLNEVLRVLKPGGILAAAYLNRTGVYLHQVFLNPQTLLNEPPSRLFGKEDAMSGSGGFTYLTPPEVERLFSQLPADKLEHAAADGVSAIMQETVNRMNGEEYAAWIELMTITNREAAHLGSGLHNLYVARKRA